MRGRKPKPTWLKVVAGNPGHRALNDNEPQPVGELRDPPAWWKGDKFEVHREIWNDAIRDAPLGLLRALDQHTLIVYVQAAALHREASIRVSETGSLVKASTGYPMQNPALAIVNKQAAIMLKAAGEMGFTPSARSRVRLDNSTADHHAEFADLPDIAGC